MRSCCPFGSAGSEGRVAGTAGIETRCGAAESAGANPPGEPLLVIRVEDRRRQNRPGPAHRYESSPCKVSLPHRQRPVVLARCSEGASARTRNSLQNALPSWIELSPVLIVLPRVREELRLAI